MAKKVIINFLDIPDTSQSGWDYVVEVNSIKLTYNSGADRCLIDFLPNGTTSTNINEIEVGLTLADTLTRVLAHLRANFVNSAITYEIADNTIEIIINAVAVFSSTNYNDNIDILQFDIDIVTAGLKYFIYFEDYYLSIRQKNYNGISTEIHGGITINKGEVNTILEPIRGTGLSLSLEANSALTFDEFGLADESTYLVQLKKGSQIVFNGFIKPDGIQQSWVRDEWYVNVECVDGLGTLNDLSFVKTNGLHYTGKISMYDAIKGCLDRTGVLMTINSSVAISYDGYTGDNILKDTYVNSERFIKTENDTVIMDCNEVLTSILNLFSACITQQDGKWWVYRPNDLIFNGYSEFIDNTLETTFTKNLSLTVGSQIDNFYPHHCDGNQQIEIKGAISAYRLNYMYGFLDGFVLNKNLVHNSSMVFANWTLTSPTEIINDPLDLQGVLSYSRLRTNTPQVTEIMVSKDYPVTEGAILRLKTNEFTSIYQQTFYYKIKRSDNLWLNNDGDWVGANTWIATTCGGIDPSPSTSTFELISKVVSADCTFKISIGSRQSAIQASPTQSYRGLCETTFIDVADVRTQSQGIDGEFHTVSRKNPPSSITKENQTVFNGDGISALIGSIYKPDLTTLTTIWTRNGKYEEKPLLRISAEDDLRIQCNPIKIFTGNFLGFIPYLSVISINNIVGLFMFTQYSYDLKNKKVTGKLTQFYNNDLGDMDYLFSYDYGNNTIKPTII